MSDINKVEALLRDSIRIAREHGFQLIYGRTLLREEERLGCCVLTTLLVPNLPMREHCLGDVLEQASSILDVSKLDARDIAHGWDCSHGLGTRWWGLGYKLREEFQPIYGY